MSIDPTLRATVDRLESDEQGEMQAVLVFDDGQQLVVPAQTLPPEVRSQQVVDISFQVNPEETARRAEGIARLQQELFGE